MHKPIMISLSSLWVSAFAWGVVTLVMSLIGAEGAAEGVTRFVGVIGFAGALHFVAYIRWRMEAKNHA